MDESIEQCRKVIELAPYDPESYRAYGWAIGNGQQRYDEAIEYIEHALEMNPRHEKSYQSISLMYANVGRYDEALAAVNRAIELGSPRPHYRIQRKAEILASAGMYDSAIVWFQKHHDMRPYNWNTILWLANLYTFSGDYRVADSIYGQMSNINDANRRAWGRYYGVKTLERQGKFREALALLQRGFEEDIADDVASGPLLAKLSHSIELNTTFLKLADTAAADLEHMRRVYDSLSDSTAFWNAWLTTIPARIDPERCRDGDCMQLLREGLEQAESYDVSRPYRYSLAEVFAETGEYDSAVHHWQILLEAEDGLDHRLWLGASLIGAGRYQEAVDELKQAMTLYSRRIWNPGEAVLCHYYLGRAYEGAGRTGDAIAQYETFLEIWKNADEGLKSVEDAKARLAKLKETI
jgi:tetratricopeptide (TPR) repeat protein